jgi:hypothetical protein
MTWLWRRGGPAALPAAAEPRLEPLEATRRLDAADDLADAVTRRRLAIEALRGRQGGGGWAASPLRRGAMLGY